MNTFKLYFSAFADIAILLFASLADLDLHIRIIAGIVGILLGILTGIKFFQDIKNKRIEGKLKHLEYSRKEEELRRFLENKYN